MTVSIELYEPGKYEVEYTDYKGTDPLVPASPTNVANKAEALEVIGAWFDATL